MSKGEDSEDPIEIVLLDVKTGRSTLNGVQKKIEAAVATGRISFDVLRINEQVVPETVPKNDRPEQLKLCAMPVKDSLHS
jgi:hypothetical protein